MYRHMRLSATFCHSQGWCFRKGGPLPANLLLCLVSLIAGSTHSMKTRCLILTSSFFRVASPSGRYFLNILKHQLHQWNLVLILGLTSGNVTPRPVVQNREIAKITRIFIPKLVVAVAAQGGEMSSFAPRLAGRLGCLHPMARVGSLSATSWWSQGGKLGVGG